ncbi:MAG: GerAB/ArcD/ProY family transporter, partial [Firmicutes bacterium]|nr:GerAB/ArcD/ProY family transporter [Bacillota bacterium]
MTGQVRIEPMQAAALIISGILGKVFIAFPGALSREAGPAGWLVITLAALFTLPALLAIIALSSRFPSRSLPEVFDHVMGRPLGLALTLIISGSFHAVGSLVTREFAESNQVGILPETPLSALIFVMLLM